MLANAIKINYTRYYAIVLYDDGGLRNTPIQQRHSTDMSSMGRSVGGQLDAQYRILPWMDVSVCFWIKNRNQRGSQENSPNTQPMLWESLTF